MFRMKNKLLIILLFLGYGMVAQEVRVDLENFSEIEISRGLKVNISQGEANLAVITGDSRDKIQVRVNKGVLVIKSSLTQLLEKDNTLINITYKQMQSLQARQNSTVEFCSKIVQPLIKIRASEGAQIFANMDVENLVATASTGGNVTLIGNALIQEIDVKAAGEFKGENLTGESVNVVSNGGGNANVFAKKYVNATVRAGGHIYIYGDPDRVEEKTSFGGTIKKIN